MHHGSVASLGLLFAIAGCTASSPLDEVQGSSGEASSTAGDDGPGQTTAPPAATTSATATGDGSGDDDGDTTGADGPETTDDGDSSSGDDTGSPQDDCTPFPEVEDFGEQGPFEITQEQDGPSCTIVRPATLGEEDRRHPVILWGNGTFTTPAIYIAVLRHWASHGFIVAAANTSNAGSGEEMLACLDWLTEQNSDEASIYSGVVDLEHVGTTGHSQGGGGALMAGQDPRITATAPLQPYTEQGFGGYDQACQTNQQGPMFLMSGDADVIAPIVPNQQIVYDDSNVPTFWGTLAGGDHIFAPIGDISRYRAPATAWFRYHLMCDELARPVFYDECTLCGDPDWDIQTQNW